MLKIVIVAGGTGGHIFPAECIARQLLKEGYDVEFITDQRGVNFIKCSEFKITIQKIYNTSKFRLILGILKNLCVNVYKFIKDRPVCVIGFGGYPSVASVLAAQILGVKTLVHEQNAVIGRANTLLAFNAKALLTSFEGTAGVCRIRPQRVRYAGNPTRFDDMYSNVTRPNNKEFTILVFGGSQGSKLFTSIVAPAICNVGSVRVFHQSRQSDVKTINDMYKDAGINATVSHFFDNMAELYQQSNLVISRSGASTVFELIGFRVPAILIPFSHSVNGDQIANARALGAGVVVLDENTLTVDKLACLIKELMDSPDKLISMSQNLPLHRTSISKFLEVINYVISH